MTAFLLLLRKVPIFSVLQFSQLLQLRDAMQPVDFAAGDIVLTEGERGDHFYIIVKGSVSVLKEDPAASFKFLEGRGAELTNGKGADPKEIATLSENSYFGERAIMHDEPRAASIRAKTRLTCLAIDREGFEVTYHRC